MGFQRVEKWEQIKESRKEKKMYVELECGIFYTNTIKGPTNLFLLY